MMRVENKITRAMREGGGEERSPCAQEEMMIAIGKPMSAKGSRREVQRIYEPVGIIISKERMIDERDRQEASRLGGTLSSSTCRQPREKAGYPPTVPERPNHDQTQPFSELLVPNLYRHLESSGNGVLEYEYMKLQRPDHSSLDASKSTLCKLETARPKRGLIAKSFNSAYRAMARRLQYTGDVALEHDPEP
ncbi:hypothetical protein CVT26_006591 [Gymnopilus dilepis]|uniref:Uncharacterized protein n=1 Tax=Gymnopilus dilepis TaxID=231916 RepID=A0A409Y2W6_9AGAR|nr:hypothetical protein CVT26_006591 [Gymnopilus dilepis]